MMTAFRRAVASFREGSRSPRGHLVSRNTPLRGDEPLVTVIMPAYNAGSYLRPAVESVVEQVYQNWELILVDDGSTDGSVKELGDIDPRIRRVSQENRGKPAAMNVGLSMARGVFYAIQDADDVSHPERLNQQVRCLLENPELAGVFCGHELIIDGQFIAPTFRFKSVADCAVDIAAGRPPAHDPTGMYRISHVKETTYAEDLPIVEGVDYIMRVGERFPLMVLGECLYAYRIHPESITMTDPRRRNRLLHEMATRMYRRRGQLRGAVPYIERNERNAWRNADNDVVSHFTASVADQVIAGARVGALHTGFASWRLHPAEPYYAKPLLYALTPRPLMRQYILAKRRRDADF